MLTYTEGDLKPDNILLDMDLHLRLQLARTLRPNALHATSVVSIAGTFDPALRNSTGRCEIEGDEVIGIADQRAEWPLEVARAMHKVAMALLKFKRNSRMSVTDARDEIRKLADGHLLTAPAHGGRASSKASSVSLRTHAAAKSSSWMP